ncbi:MAG: hypothetical protein U9N56_02610 [Actinomycetota bacterium]|nr:hypothetical protein [Actinomycetota bacterium]
MNRHKRQRPAWLIGLIIAIVVFGVGLVLFQVLGFGDDPVVGASSDLARLISL